VTSDGFIFYIQRAGNHFITSHFVPAPMSSTCGGFLCDEVRCSTGALSAPGPQR
jgi:hypothetical protein